jgi:hypothetical protein
LSCNYPKTTTEKEKKERIPTFSINCSKNNYGREKEKKGRISKNYMALLNTRRGKRERGNCYNCN